MGWALLPIHGPARKKVHDQKDSKRHLKDLQLNTAVFNQLGGQYIFSALPIDNAEENQQP